MKKAFILLISIILLSCEGDGAGNNTNSSESGTGGSMARFILVGDYLYTVDSSSLNVFSLLNSDKPVQVNTVRIGFEIETLFNYDHYLFIGSQNGMFIYDIQKAEEPIYVSEAQHFRSCDPVVANATHAYVTLFSERSCGGGLTELQVYDIENIKKPKLISNRQLRQPKGLGLYGNYLFVCDDVIKVFDITDPQNTILAHSIDSSSFDVIIIENHLYAIGDNLLMQFSLDPNQITNTKALSVLSF